MSRHKRTRFEACDKANSVSIKAKLPKDRKMGKSKGQSGGKAAAVTEPVKIAKAKVEEVSKKATKAVAPVEKSKKKKAKEPTPEPVEESDSEEESEDSVEHKQPKDYSEDEGSSESSDAESEEDEKPAPKANISKKVNGTSDSKANGKVKGVNGTTQKAAEAKKQSKAVEPDTSDSSDSSDDEATPTKFKPDSDADDDESEESDSSDDQAEKAKPHALPKKAKADDSSDSSGSDEESDEETKAPNGDLEMKDGTSDSSEESEEEAPPKKRKAESDAAPMSKKPKTESATDDVKNLFVGQLSWNVDDEWLAREFEQAGEVVSARVIIDRESGRSRGFGYVEFATCEEAQKALAELQGTEVDGRKIKVDLAAKRDNNNNNNNNGAARQERGNRYGDQLSSPSDTLYVANLPFSVNNDMVGEKFEPFGSILGIRLPTDRETGAPKGFGYVQFGSVEEATAALNGAQGMEIGGRRPRLDFSSPRPSGDNAGRGDRGGRGGFGGRGRGGDRGGRGGGRGGRGGFESRGGARGGRGGSTNRGGFGDFQGKKMTF